MFVLKKRTSRNSVEVLKCLTINLILDIFASKVVKNIWSFSLTPNVPFELFIKNSKIANVLDIPGRISKFPSSCEVSRQDFENFPGGKKAEGNPIAVGRAQRQ